MFRAASERHMSVNSAIITIGDKGAIQSVDKGACQMFGYELEELMGQKVNKLLPTPYREQHDAYLQNYHKTGRKRIIGMSRLVEGQHKDGSIFPIRLAVSEVQMGSSKMFIGMIDRVEDTAGTVTANNEGTIISCNKQCEAIWGYSVSELVGRNLSILMPSPHREQHDLYIANYRRTGQMKVINHTRNVPARHKNGTVFPVSLQVTKLKVGVVELFKGRVEKIDTEMEAVFTLDKRGVIVSCNRNFVAPLFGYTDTELIGKHIRVLVPSLTKESANHQSSSTTTTTTSSSSSSSPAEGSSSCSSPSTANGDGASRKRKRSQRPGDSNAQEEVSEGEGEGGSLETDHSIETQTNRLQNVLSRGEQDSTERHGEGADKWQEDEDNVFGDEAQLKPEQEPGMDSSWSLSGRRRLQVRHKDGSVFPVDFSISKFTKDDVDETDTSMAEGEESVSHTAQDNNLVGDYIVEGNVGQGSYGKVKLAYHRVTRQQVAIKILQKDLMDSAEQERSRREIAIQRKLLHPHIARLFDVLETDDRINIVMEYSEGGELLTYITKQGKLNESEARRLFLQLLSAIQYCHSFNIIHRDIKHKNILLDGSKNIKLIDFGLSNYSQVGALRSTFCGTPAYAAPEMILAKKYVGPEVDVWSMGVVLFTMVAGRFPFGNVSHIIEGQYTLPETISPVLADLLRKMLTVDAEKRISVNEINMHPWVALGGKELPPLRPYSLGSAGLAEHSMLPNAGEWSHHTTPSAMLPQDVQSHYGGMMQIGAGVHKPAPNPMYIRSHYPPLAPYGGEPMQPPQSAHPVRILPKTPPQQPVSSDYTPFDGPTGLPGLAGMGIHGVHPIGGMHGLQGIGGGMVSPNRSGGSPTGHPSSGMTSPYYGYGHGATAVQPDGGPNGDAQAAAKRRKMEAYGVSPPSTTLPQYYRSAATTETTIAGGRMGTAKEISCSVISTVTDGSERDGKRT